MIDELVANADGDLWVILGNVRDDLLEVLNRAMGDYDLVSHVEISRRTSSAGLTRPAATSASPRESAACRCGSSAAGSSKARNSAASKARSRASSWAMALLISASVFIRPGLTFVFW